MSWRAVVPNAFTTVNLLGGVAGICLCVLGRPYDAGIAVMLGYLLGDVADGAVARLLGVSSRFGAEYDTITDHVSQAVAPAAIVFVVYHRAGLLEAPWNDILAAALASMIVVTSSIRHARNVVAPVSAHGIWAGLPRTVLGFLVIGYCNSTLAPFAPGGWWWGVGLVPAMSVVTLIRIPFASHHLGRRHRGWIRVVIVAFFVTTFGALVLDPRWMFDLLFLWMVGYSTGGWISLTPAERADFREAVRAARKSESSASS